MKVKSANIKNGTVSTKSRMPVTSGGFDKQEKGESPQVDVYVMDCWISPILAGVKDKVSMLHLEGKDPGQLA